MLIRMVLMGEFSSIQHRIIGQQLETLMEVGQQSLKRLVLGDGLNHCVVEMESESGASHD